MVMLSIGMMGIYSMSTIQARQTGRLHAVLPEHDSDPAFNRAESDWARKLGVYTSVDDKLIKLDDPESLIPIEVIQDDSHSKVKYKKYKKDWWGWTDWDYSPAYLGSCHYHYSQGNVGSRVEFEIKNLQKERYYEVLITYPAFASLGSAIPVEIYDNNKLLATRSLNQRVPPSDASYHGRMWHSLGTYYFKHDDVKVKLLDGPTSRNFIIADAILVRTPRLLSVVSQGPTGTGGATVTLQVAP